MKMPRIVTDLAARLAGARDAVKSLHAIDVDSRRQRAELEAERAKLVGARPPRAVVIAEAERQVNALGDEWVKAHGVDLVSAIAGRLDLGPWDNRPRGIITGHLLSEGGFPGYLDLGTLCALAPGIVKEGLRAIIGATTYEAGPELSERARLIEQVDERIRDVIQEHTDLVDAAAAEGIVLELFPEERAKRIAAADRQQQIARHNSLNRDAIQRGTVKAMVE